MEDKLRESIFSKIKDLKEKIEINEDTPEGGRVDVDGLVQIDDYLENCLNYWYY